MGGQPRSGTAPSLGPGGGPSLAHVLGGPSTREPGTLGPWGHLPASPLLRGVVFSLLTLSVLIA